MHMHISTSVTSYHCIRVQQSMVDVRRDDVANIECAPRLGLLWLSRLFLFLLFFGMRGMLEVLEVLVVVCRVMLSGIFIFRTCSGCSLF